MKAARPIETVILTIRGEKVILDSDLAAIYGVPTKQLNQAIKRNAERFPEDFAFRLTPAEWAAVISQNATSNAEARSSKKRLSNRSQIVTGSQKHRDPRLRPYVFTEHGALQAANILRSPRAVEMSLFVTRAFVKMRETLLGTRDLARKLAALEKQLTGRLDSHEAAIVHVLQELMSILNPPPLPPARPKPRIGFNP